MCGVYQALKRSYLRALDIVEITHHEVDKEALAEARKHAAECARELTDDAFLKLDADGDGTFFSRNSSF